MEITVFTPKGEYIIDLDKTSDNDLIKNNDMSPEGIKYIRNVIDKSSRDLITEIDNIKSRLAAIESQIPFTTG